MATFCCQIDPSLKISRNYLVPNTVQTKIAAMAQDIEHFRTALLTRQRELEEEIARFEENVKTAQGAEVEDPIDVVTSSQAKSAAATETTIAADTLSAVRAALQRIETGEYGICVDCGRPIEEKRLEAVPWTPYCLEDQEKHDREKAEPSAFDSVI
jgi:DnaK suppressor protein